LETLVATLTGPDGLEWTLKRLLLPVGMQAPGLADIIGKGTFPASPNPQAPRLAIVGVTGPGPFGGVFVFLFGLPLLPLVLLLRALRWLPWTIEAKARPWGRGVPPIVHHYEIRGRVEADRALGDLAAALLRGDGAPVIAGALRVD
jgi:hypothetical protein